MAYPEGPRPRKEQREIPKKFNIAVLVSPVSSGSNLRAILDAQQSSDFSGKVSVVIADKASAPGLQIARDNGITDLAIPFKRPQDQDAGIYRDVYSTQVGQVLSGLKADIAVLAGFNRILTEEYFQAFRGPTINIHPGAIPDAYGVPFRFEDGTEAPWNQGMMTEAAVANFLPLNFATSTIHIATIEADKGPVLKRVIVPVEPQDTVDSLYGRLKLAEHRGLVEVLKNPPIKK